MQWLTAYAASDASKRVRSVLEVALLDLDDLDKLHGVETADVVVKTLAKRLNGIDSIFLVRRTGAISCLGSMSICNAALRHLMKWNACCVRLLR